MIGTAADSRQCKQVACNAGDSTTEATSMLIMLMTTVCVAMLYINRKYHTQWRHSELQTVFWQEVPMVHV
jgi:hypothetical protein